MESAVEIVSSLTHSKEAPFFFFSALGFHALFLEGVFFFFLLNGYQQEIDCA